MDFSKFATPVTVKAPKQDNRAKVVGFLTQIAEQGFRISYHGVHAVAYGQVTRGTPTYKGILERLPVELQYVICKKDGSYAKEALEAWGDIAPEGFETRPVIQDRQALEAFAEFCAE